jgi:subtilisin family serine protease
MATAYTSGAAALVRAAYPGDSPAQLIGRLLAAVDPLSSLSGTCVSGGRLNLRKALGVEMSRPRLKATSGSGEFFLLLSGDPGREYAVEASTNFHDWWPVSTKVTGLDGSFILTNSLATNPCSQFYRAHLMR